MADIGRILRTVRHLRLPQVVYQVAYRVWKPKYRQVEAPAGSRGGFFAEWTVKPTSLLEHDRMSFLNLDGPADWNYTEHGMLWAYNMNYMDWLHQQNIEPGKRMEWMLRFMKDLPCNRIGLDPYPIALRSINWIKALTTDMDMPSAEKKTIEDSLWSQLKLLEKKLEYHLLGNHLLEDAFALFIAAVYFRDGAMLGRAGKLLAGQLKEQVLNDGCHYEQSPMYQCVLLDRLLDCYNIAYGTSSFVDADLTASMKVYCQSMLAWLQTIAYRDGSIPLLNDSSRGIAPTPEELFDYGRRLQLAWTPASLKDCGYRKMEAERMEAVVDIGNITATYQPGHTHADTFSYELRVDGRPFIVDSGITTYNKNERRQYERGTKAHNTVTVDGRDSSEVWGGFRVGRRATVKVLADEEGFTRAVHDGYGSDCLHERAFRMGDNEWTVEDKVSGDGAAVSFIHFDSGLQPVVNGNMVNCGAGCVVFEGAEKIEVLSDFVASEYNRPRQANYLAVTFKKTLIYRITITQDIRTK